MTGMVATLVALILNLNAKGEPDLIKRSQLITKVSGWVEGQLTVGIYVWLTPNELAAFTTQSDATVLDIRTGAKRAMNSPAVFWGRYQGISPDGSKVFRQDWKDQDVTWTVLTLKDGRLIGSWSIRSHDPRPGMDEDTGTLAPTAIWDVSGTRIYQMESWRSGSRLHYEAVEHDATHPEIAHRYSADVAADVWFLSAHERKILAFDHYPQGRTCFLYEWNLEQHGQAWKSWKVHAPANLFFAQSPIASPDGKHLLWEAGRSGKNNPADNAGYPYRDVSLWVSDADGGHMKELGVIDFHTRNDEKQMLASQHFGEVHWNPDSKRVSYIYNRKLYIVRAY